MAHHEERFATNVAERFFVFVKNILNICSYGKN